MEAFDQPEDECERTGKHSVHVISITTPPKSIKLWPELQNPDDVSEFYVLYLINKTFILQFL